MLNAVPSRTQRHYKHNFDIIKYMESNVTLISLQHQKDYNHTE